uniref:Uncharacterized protein n=1 Tax=Oryza meridionalis TaxID=40149 RepID=A0A0E0F740_9ORYZ
MSYCDNNAEISYINEFNSDIQINLIQGWACNDGPRITRRTGIGVCLLSQSSTFYEMQELFLGSNANGSLATDQQTCYNIDRKSDSSDHEDLNDMSTYAHPINIAKEDSDTLPSPTCPDNFSPGTSRVSKRRPRDVKSPSKRQPKPKSRFTDVTEKIGNTMDRLVNQLASPPPPSMPQLHDPYATMWKRMDALPIGSKDLGRQEKEGVRGFFAASCDTTLETWVYHFMCDRDGV